MNFKMGDKVKVVHKDWIEAILKIMPKSPDKEFYGIIKDKRRKSIGGDVYYPVDFYNNIDICFLTNIAVKECDLELIPPIDYSLLQEIEE